MLYVHNGLGTGGAERSLAELARSLPAHGIMPIIACLYRRTEGVQAEVEATGVAVRHLPPGPGQRLRSLRRLIRDASPALVHTTIFEADLAGRLAAVGGPPVISSIVNTSYDPVRLAADPNVRRWPLLAARCVDGWTARHLTDHFHAISETVKHAAVRDLHLSADRITVIPRGRDPDALGRPGPKRRRQARAALDLREDAEVVVNVARREYQKGQRYLIEAVGTLLERRPRLILLVAGRRGHAADELDRLARGTGERIRFLGHRDDIPQILAAADLFVFPSLFEGLGGAVIEAMALGLPIVASDLPALREVVEPDGNALLVPPGAAAALAAAIDGLLDDGGRRARFAARSWQLFDERFELSRTTAEMVALYRKLMDERTRPDAEGDRRWDQR